MEFELSETMEAFLEFIFNLENLKSIAIICGSPAAIITFFKLVKRDKNKEMQLSKLADVVESQENQIVELQRSVEQLTLIAQYQSQFVDMYREGLTASKERQGLEMKLEKARIRPKMSFSGGTNHDYRFKNIGQDAKIFDIEIVEGKSSISFERLIKDQTIPKGSEFHISVNDRIEPEKREKHHVKIFYIDEIGTKYCQDIFINLKMSPNSYKITCSDPTEI